MISKRKIKINALNDSESTSIKEILKSRSYQVEENINEHISSADLMFVGADFPKEALNPTQIRNGFKFPIIYITNKGTQIKTNNNSDIVVERPLISEKILKSLDEALTKSNASDYISEDRSELIISESNEEVCNYIRKFVEINYKKTCLISTTTVFNVKKLETGKYNSIINLKRINDAPTINKLLEEVNKKLPTGSKFIGCAETSDLRKRRILFKYLPVLNKLYFFFDYIFKRVFPKLPITKWLYYKLTSGRNRVLSRAEVLGRLYSCGFKVVDTEVINGMFYFVVEKEKQPLYEKNPSYGPIFAMKRISKGGKIINVYKMRTMYPYSEFLQAYIYEMNNLEEGGKIKDDFRVSTVGKLFRKFWIDELPMFINFFKGEMKFIGVRPLSNHYFSLYEKDLQELRMKVKPGLVPPFYADMPKTMQEIQDSERRYINSYMKYPITTDIKYFFKIFYNIIFRNARSK